jgi:hypothetical protein
VKEAQRPTRFSRARKLVAALYWTMAIGLGISVAWSATTEAFKRPTIDDPLPTDVEMGSPEAAACVDELEAHHAALVEQAAALVAASGGLSDDVHGAWERWSTGWHQAVERTRVRCRIHSRGALSELNPLVEDLERVRLAYSTAFKGFHDVGRRPVRRLREAFEGGSEGALR